VRLELLSVRGLRLGIVVALCAGACTSLNTKPPETGTAGAGGDTGGTAGTGGTAAGGTGGGGTGGGGTGGLAGPAGLIAFWRFNEGSGTTVADSSGNGQPLAISTGSRWTTAGHEGAAFAFDGVADVASFQPVLGHLLWDYPTIPLTMSAWVRPDDAAAARPFATAVARTHEDFAFQDFWLGLMNGRPACTIHSPSKEGVVATGLAPSNTWTHIACAYGLSGDAILYVNGMSAGSINTPQNLGPIETAILVGASETNTDGVHDFFPGAIDDVRMYNTTLSSFEVAFIAGQ
jgi:hypothetical protein